MSRRICLLLRSMKAEGLKIRMTISQESSKLFFLVTLVIPLVHEREGSN
jgi:hypothetical protein